MKLLRGMFAVVKQNAGIYAALNLAYYGLVIVGMLVSALNPDIQSGLQKAIKTSLEQGPLQSVVSAYQEKRVVEAALLTFAVNLVLGSFVSITLPSLVIPFTGLLMGAFRAFLWGLIFSPITPQTKHLFFPHGVTLLLEGQAYIVVLLAVVVQGKAFLWPQTVGVSSSLQGYIEGLRRTGKLYVLVTILLALAAIYEALEVLWVVD